MRVIGIDLGTICCGYGIVEVRSRKLEVESKKLGVSLEPDHFSLPPSPFSLIYITSGEIRMNKKDPLPMKLKLLYSSLKKIIDEYKPSHLCVEKIFYHKSIRSVFTLGSTQGIVMLLAAENAMPLFEYNSTELKQAITGYGRAEKQQVKEMVIRILTQNTEHRIQNTEFLNLTEDAADALALCICHINHHTGYNSK